MPESHTQTTASEPPESDIRLALGIGAAVCCLNFGNSFASCSVAPTLHHAVANSSHQANASMPFLSPPQFAIAVMMPFVLAAVCLPVVGWLLDRQMVGPVAAILSLVSAAGRALQLFLGATAPTAFVIGQTLGTGAFLTLHCLQVRLENRSLIGRIARSKKKEFIAQTGRFL